MRQTLAALLPLVIVAAACANDSAAGSTSSDIARIDSLASPAAPGSGEPNIAAAPDGRVYLTWLEPAGAGHALRIARMENGSWSAPATVAQGDRFFVNWADFPSIVALDDRRLAAHWLQRSDTGRYDYDVRVAQSADGGVTWGPGVVPHRDGTAAEHGFASLWLENDRLAAVWLDGRKYARPTKVSDRPPAKEMMLAHTTLGPDGSLGEERILDERICDCCQTSVARARSGPVIVYRDRSPEEIRDIYVVRHVNGAWTQPVPVHSDGWHIEACPVNGPSVDARDDLVAVAWFTGAQDTARVLAAFSRDGGATFGTPVRVDGGAPAGRVDVVLAADGAALVSWVERTAAEGQEAAGAEVRVRRVAQDGALGAPATVARSTAARASGFPRMTAVGDSLYLAWTIPGTPSTVRVARAVLGG
jgi:hypothetical protein